MIENKMPKQNKREEKIKLERKNALLGFTSACQKENMDTLDQSQGVTLIIQLLKDLKEDQKEFLEELADILGPAVTLEDSDVDEECTEQSEN